MLAITGILIMLLGYAIEQNCMQDVSTIWRMFFFTTITLIGGMFLLFQTKFSLVLLKRAQPESGNAVPTLMAFLLAFAACLLIGYEAWLKYIGVIRPLGARVFISIFAVVCILAVLTYIRQGLRLKEKTSRF